MGGSSGARGTSDPNGAREGRTRSPSAGSPDPRERRALALLGAGAALGLFLATAALVAPTPARDGRSAERDAVAIVNDAVIRRDDYLRLLAGVEQDSKDPLDAEKRRHVLDRMIDEELLVQRALELGLARVDRRVRADLTSTLIASIVSGAEDDDPEPGELEAFYDAERDFFARPGRLHVRQVFLRVPTGADEAGIVGRAEAARRALLAGEPLAAVRERYGDEEIAPVPDAPLPALKLREYIGPTALRAVEALAIGEVSEPVRSGVGLHVFVLADRTESSVPPFAEIADQVEQEWRRRAGDRALRAYLDQLREEGDVRVLDQSPSA